MRNESLLLGILTVCLLGASCEEISGPPAVPSAQIWVVSWHPDCGLGSCGTNVAVIKGGAIGQYLASTRVVSANGSCTYSAPIIGQWSGTIFKFTMNGGGCGGEQLQGFTQGNANGEYGTATNAQGRITWTFNNGPSITQTWTAHFVRNYTEE